MQELSGLALSILAACPACSRGESLEGGAPEPPTPSLELVAVIETAGSGTEIVSIHAASSTALVLHTNSGTVELFDLRDPAAPTSSALHEIQLGPDEELTSVAAHPSWDAYFLAVCAADPLGPGRLLVNERSTGRRLAELSTGVHPDCVGISPDGRHALVANEGEAFVLRDGELWSPPGSLTLVAMGGDPSQFEVRQIPLPDASGVPGTVGPDDGRVIEREVDGELIGVPLVANTPLFTEPEVVAFAPDGRRAYVTLQEQNAVAVVDVASARVTAVHGLGTTRHAADLADDGRYEPTGELFALREPDGIAVTPNGRYYVTADEGDTDPGPGETPEGKPTGGGRTMSVFDAATGRFLGDTGDQLDEGAAAAGVYPDSRSDRKGSEPEMLVAFEIDGTPYAAVGLERADAVALVGLGDPANPSVVALAAIAGPEVPEGPHAPEGIAHHLDAGTGRHFVITANEQSGTLAVFRVDL